MENKQEQVINQEVNVDQFPTDEMLKNMGITREEFEKKVEENKNISLEDKIAELEEIQRQNEEYRKQLEEMNKQLEKNNLNMALANNGLSEFAGLFDLETVEEKVEFLKKVKNDILIANAYIPKDVAKQDEYTQALEQKDVNKAISFKLSKLFGGK